MRGDGGSSGHSHAVPLTPQPRQAFLGRNGPQEATVQVQRALVMHHGTSSQNTGACLVTSSLKLGRMSP